MRYLLFILASALLVYGQSQNGAVELRRANSLHYGEESGQRVQELDGNVYIVKDSLEITCDKALYYPDSGKLIFRDNVMLQDGQRLMFAREVRYSDWTEELEAEGDLRIYQDSITIYCNRAVYRERLGSGYLYDNVRVKYDPRGVQITGEIGYFDHRTKSAWVSREPVLTQRDSLGTLTTKITGDTITYNESSGLATSRDDVTITRDSLNAYGDLLEFYMDSLFAELTGKPLALSSADSISGDSMRLFFKDEALERVEVHGNAVASSPSDTLPGAPRQILTGKLMTLWIEQSALSRALVEDNATATYFVRDKQDAEGLNVTSGDRLIITFENRRISRIRVEGGTEGKYTPESLVAGPAPNKP
jgi:lipopolysaccharide export system protein LptA